MKTLKKIAALLTAGGMLIATPVFADTTYSVVNTNTASVDNSISISANTGGNTSTGGIGGDGGKKVRTCRKCKEAIE